MSYLAYYRFNGDGLDVSGNNYHMSAVGTNTYTAGKFNQSIYSSGPMFTNNRLEYVGDVLGAIKTFTVSLWGKANTSTTMAMWCTIKTTTQDNCYYFFCPDANGFTVGKFKRTGTGEYSGTWHETNGSFPVGTTWTVWNHYCGVWNNGIVTAFVNGKQIQSASIDNNNGTSNIVTSNISTGSDAYITVVHPIGGYMDECLLENAAWTAAQVRNYYNFSMGRYAPKIRF